MGKNKIATEEKTTKTPATEAAPKAIEQKI